MTKYNLKSDFAFAERVLLSCKNLGHVPAANNLVKLFAARHGNTILTIRLAFLHDKLLQKYLGVTATPLQDHFNFLKEIENG